MPSPPAAPGARVEPAPLCGRVAVVPPTALPWRPVHRGWAEQGIAADEPACGVLTAEFQRSAARGRRGGRGTDCCDAVAASPRQRVTSPRTDDLATGTTASKVLGGPSLRAPSVESRSLDRAESPTLEVRPDRDRSPGRTRCSFAKETVEGRLRARSTPPARPSPASPRVAPPPSVSPPPPFVSRSGSAPGGTRRSRPGRARRPPTTRPSAVARCQRDRDSQSVSVHALPHPPDDLLVGDDVPPYHGLVCLGDRSPERIGLSGRE